MEYINFQIQIDKVGQNYQVQVPQSAGVSLVPPAILKLPTELLPSQIARMVRPRKDDAPPTKDAAPDRDAVGLATNVSPLRSPRELGRLLTDALFSDDITNSFVNARRDLRSAPPNTLGYGVRIRLRIRPTELIALPWELLLDPTNDDHFLCHSPETPVTRLAQDSPSLSRSSAIPLPVLGMIGPQSSVRLDLDTEKRRITQYLTPPQDSKTPTPDTPFELIWVDGYTEGALQSALSRKESDTPFRIFHFAGHGTSGAPDGVSGLILHDAESRLVTVSGEKLAKFFAGKDVRLVVLNCCKSATADVSNLFKSVAESLTAHGVQAVIGMQNTISDTAANTFAAKLYEEIAKGHPIEIAVTEARLALFDPNAARAEWSTPVLYLNAESGRLFEPAAPKASGATPIEQTRSVAPVVSPPTSPSPLPESGVVPEVEWLRKILPQDRGIQRLFQVGAIVLTLAGCALLTFAFLCRPPDLPTGLSGATAGAFAAVFVVVFFATKNRIEARECLLETAGTGRPSEQWFKNFYRMQANMLERHS